MTLIKLKKQYVLYLCLLAIIISIVILASVPPISRDALTHHLYLPKLYLQARAIYEIVDIDFSYFPMNLDLLYLVPLAWGNDIIPKYIHFFFSLCTATIIFFHLNKRLTSIWALLAAILFLTIPVIVKLSIVAYVDLGLVFFSTASLFLVLQWAERENQILKLVGAGICCGLAIGTKYNGLISLLILSLLIPVLHQKRSHKETVSTVQCCGYSLLFVGVSFLVFSPWAIRNIVWTGNPFFPLFGGVFNTADTNVMGGMGPFVTRSLLYHENLFDVLLIPFRIFFEGRDNNPQFFDGVLNPCLLIFPFFAFVGKEDCKKIIIEKWALLTFALLYLLIAFFQRDLRVRYIGPIIPPLVILSICGMRNAILWCRAKDRGGSSLLFFTSIVIFASYYYNFNYIITQFKYIQPFSYLSGSVSRSDYITHYRPEYPLVTFANKHLMQSDQILGIFLGNRGYYFDIPVVFDMQKGESLLAEVVNNVDSLDDVKLKLKGLGLTHILIRDDMFLKWFPTFLSVEKFTLLNSYFRRETTVLKNINGHSLYKLN